MIPIAIDKIRCSAGLFGDIYIGRINKKGDIFLEKENRTDEVICAVRDCMESTFIKDGQTTGGWEWKKKDGTIIELRITAKIPVSVDGE